MSTEYEYLCVPKKRKLQKNNNSDTGMHTLTLYHVLERFAVCILKLVKDINFQ